MQCILTKLSKKDIVTDPFPHAVIHDALDEDYYRLLEAEYPSSRSMMGDQEPRNNARYQLSAYQALSSELVTPAWREFIQYHVSSAFFSRVLDLFGDHLRRLHPDLEAKLGKPLEALTVGVRSDPERPGDLLLDCQPGINSAVTERSRVRGPHLDNPKKLFAGLFYMRTAEDDSTGSDLELFRYRGRRYYFFGEAELEDRFVEKVATIPYRRNTFVLFLNALQAIHGVSPRSITPHERRLVNFIGEMPNLPEGGLFPLRRASLLDRALRKVGLS